jgi:membrane protease YdiL (CAAX protease family)
MIAPKWHLLVFFVIIAWILYAGWAAQQHAIQNPDAGGAGPPQSHPGAIRAWLGSAIADMFFLLFCWAGVRAQGGNLLAMAGGRWRSWQQLGRDLAAALPFWVVWELVAYGAYWILGPSQAKTVFPLIPRTAAEALVWVFLSVTAGFCEELIFRGYLQRQLLAVSGNVVAAVLGQALVFGLVHSYQGWKAVTVIAALGVLYGTLAAARSNLRANIIAHAWSDLFEGWLKFLMLPRWFPS